MNYKALLIIIVFLVSSHSSASEQRNLDSGTEFADKLIKSTTYLGTNWVYTANPFGNGIYQIESNVSENYSIDFKISFVCEAKSGLVYFYIDTFDDPLPVATYKIRYQVGTSSISSVALSNKHSDFGDAQLTNKVDVEGTLVLASKFAGGASSENQNTLKIELPFVPHSVYPIFSLNGFDMALERWIQDCDPPVGNFITPDSN